MKKLIAFLILTLALSACATSPEETRMPPELKDRMLGMVREGNILGFNLNEFKVSSGTSKEFYFVLMNPNEDDCIDISINCVRAKEGECLVNFEYPKTLYIKINDAKVYPIFITMPENANSVYLSKFQAFPCNGPIPFAEKQFYVNSG